MNILKKIPIPLDYFLGSIMIVSGAYMFKTYLDLIEIVAEETDLVLDWMKYIVLLVGGLVMIVLPGKNMRRTIWLSGTILSLSLISEGLSEISLYYYLADVGYTKFTLFHFSFGILNAGCGLAMLINSLLFACRTIKSIYVIIISLVLAFTIEYFTMEFNYDTTIGWYDYLKVFVKTYLPNYLLLFTFAILFTSDEVSWYTRKGGMARALNRLRTTNSVFSIRTLTRDQLVLLMQCDGDYTLELKQGKYRCHLDVSNSDGKKTLVFRRAGEDSMVGALYLDIYKIVPEGSISKCRYVEMFGKDGDYIRMGVTEAAAKRPDYVLLQKEVAHIPSMYFSLPNKSLYDLVDGTGRYTLGTRIPHSDKYSVEIVGTGSGRAARFYRNGEAVTTMNLAAVVPYCIYGTYTRLYLYGDMGAVIILKVRS